MQVYTLNDGEDLVKAARDSIELFLITPSFNKNIVEKNLNRFTDHHGVFVTLEHYPTRTPRGCIGFPRAVAPIKESVIDAAIAAAFEDPRFVSVSKHELNELLVEVSVLSKLVRLEGGEQTRKKSVEVGRDGLLIEYGVYSGLLLPNVPVEQGWDKKKFLQQVCIKASLHSYYWAQPNVKIYKFETQRFREETPNGKIIEIKHK